MLHTDDGVPSISAANVTVGHPRRCCTALRGGRRLADRHQRGGAQPRGDRQNCPHRRQLADSRRQGDPDRSLVCGSPGRIIRELTDNEIAKLKLSADNYVNNALRYQKQLRQALCGAASRLRIPPTRPCSLSVRLEPDRLMVRSRRG